MLSQLEQECLSIWQSPAADVFLSKLREMQNQMQCTKKQIVSLADTIRSCADRIMREDEEQARRASQLSDGASGRFGGGGGGSRF